MRYTSFFSVIVFLALTLACQRRELVEIIPESNTDSYSQPKSGVWMSMPDISFDDIDIRSSMDVGSSGLVFSWSPDDAVGVYSDLGGFARFSLTEGEGASAARFDGAGFSLQKGSSYYAFYPYDMSRSDKDAVILNYGDQAASGDNDITSLLEHDYLFSSAVAEDEGSADFRFNHAGSFLRMKLYLPAGIPVENIEFIPSYEDIPTELSLDMTTGVLTPQASTNRFSLALDKLTVPDSGVLTVWAVIPARDYSNEAFSVFVSSGEDIYSFRHVSPAFRQGKAYRWDVTPVLQSEPADYGFTAVTEASSFSPGTGDVPSGEYSGITWLGGTRYAVVHDKFNGGGIVYYDIVIDDSGSVSSVSMSVPEGTTMSSESSLDNEGIAYVPSSNTLFVSSEARQSIREYSLDGSPTGRSLIIPSDLATGSISPNKGFEALSFNENTSCFWTITESATLRDMSTLDGLVRLQSFGLDLKPAERYFYRMDEPTKSSSDAAAAKSYVHGVPALAALDDGRILILEREVYVPNGNAIQMALNSFTKLKLFAVRPSADNAGILRKTLVKSFQTSAFNLANYEGMCLGPTLSDGSRALVLIPDSQGGMSGLTKEYVKVISIK